MNTVKNNLKLKSLLLVGILTSSLSASAAIFARYDAADFTNAGSLTGWADSSGNGNQLFQTTPSQRPTVVTGVQNGLSVVRFNAGAANHLENSTTSYTVGSVFAVAFHNATVFPGGGNGFQGLYGGDDTGDAIYYTGTEGGTTWFANEFSDTYLNGASSSTALTNPSAFNLYSGVDSTPATLNGTTIGIDRNNGTRVWDGDIGEVIVYATALSDYDRNGVEVYLDEKWGLGLDLRNTYGEANFNQDILGLGLVQAPEPSSLALLLMGGMLLAGIRRKRAHTLSI